MSMWQALSAATNKPSGSTASWLDQGSGTTKGEADPGRVIPPSKAARTIGSAVASDAFFPFADGLMAAVEAGATAVIQPGGSMRDSEVIAAADEAGLAMVFTGMRHFRH